MNTITSSAKVQNDHILLRRPRPPKQALKLPSPSDGVTFDIPSPHSATPKSIMVRYQSLPTHHDIYRTDIEEMVHERSKFIIHSPHPKGPEFFPPGRTLHAPTQISMDPFDILPDVILLPGPEHTFTLDNFRIQVEADHPPLQISQGMISRQNYLKLTSWFTTNVPTQENMNTLDLEVDYQAPTGRVPRGQILVGKLVMLGLALVNLRESVCVEICNTAEKNCLESNVTSSFKNARVEHGCASHIIFQKSFSTEFESFSRIRKHDA